MNHPMDMSGKRVLVTGASSGLGRDLSLLLSELGARVVLVARNVSRLNETRSRLQGTGHVVHPFDLNDGDQIPEMLSKLALEAGPLHGLVHCAGIAPIRPLRVETLAQVNNVLQMNVSTAILLARGFRQKGCREREASIVLVSSVMGLLGEKARAAYCASKGAIVSLTKALALELASEEIRVNCVAPALVRTEMHEALSESLTEAQKAELSAASPLGLGRPRDVSHAMAFLLSDASRWITGTTLVVDGGYSAQ